MALLEGRLVFLFKRLDQLDDGFNKSDQRLDGLEQTSIKLVHTIAFAKRLLWIILTGAAGLFCVYLK